MSGISGSGFDFSVLNGYYAAKTQAALTRASNSAHAPASSASSSRASDSGLAPWNSSASKDSDTAKLMHAMSTTSFVDLNNADFNKAGVSMDSKKLFALYTGLMSLQSLAQKSAADDTLSGQRTGLDTRFQNGLDQIKSFVSGTGFDDLTMLFGAKAAKVDSDLAIPRSNTVYSGKAIVQGASSNAIQGLTGSEVFTVKAVKGSGTFDVTMDLSQISGPLSVDNIVDYMNQKMQDAGLLTRFKRDVFDGKTADSPKSYGIAMQSVATEKISFSAATTSPAIYVAGISGSGSTQTGQLVKLTDSGSSVTTNFSEQIAPESGVADVRGSTTDSAGNTYVVGTTTGDLDQEAVQGSKDVFLRKYDSAGHLIWSQLLGSSTTADGFGVATDAKGNVAIVGRVTDRLNDKATGGNGDSFVAKYDANGNEVFTRQIAPVLDDQANTVTFGADGSLYVAGQTKGVMTSSATNAGGTDAYLQKLTDKGTLVYTRQIGTSGDDRASGVTVDGDGNVVLATVEDGDAVVRKYAPDDGTSAAIWEMNLGDVGTGTVGGVTVSNGSVYVSGTTTNNDLTAGGQATVAQTYSGGSDGFVFKIDDAGTSATANFVSYIGTNASDSAGNVVVNNGEIYVAGSTKGSLTGGTAPTASNSYVAKLDANGQQVWVHQSAGAAGAGAARSISIDPTGGSVLDTLGLPTSTSFDSSRTITSKSSVRAGDYFYVSVNGLNVRKITVQAGDTMRSLAARITGTLALKGTAKVTYGSGGDKLTISANEGSVIELKRGAGSFDALAGLGILPGKLYNTNGTQPATTGDEDKNVFALGLSTTASLSTQANSRMAMTGINSALQAIRNAYQAITTASSSSTTSRSSVSGDVQRQLASYQTAVAALGG
jgi:hypothetical protein